MRFFILILFFIFSSITLSAQNLKYLYFQEVEGSTWTSAYGVTDSALIHAKDIGLGLYWFPKDSIKRDCSVWQFTDSLSIENYNSHIHRFIPVFKGKYMLDPGNRLLIIFIRAGKEVKFTYCPVSTGSFVLLSREMTKRKKK